MSAHQWNILVVEDDADGQMVMSTLLEHLNISVDIAANAAEAEQFLFQSDNSYDAAIIDLALPDKDGWQILTEILEDSQTANLPCIAATAYHTSKLREDAILAGFKAYFPKPIDGTKFLRELESLLS
ncbi:MAG: response regulator [Chloroflexota bacterium]